MKELWVEKYRPKVLKEYVVRDDAQRQQIQSWINDKAIPHLLLSGAPGVGKTTFVKEAALLKVAVLCRVQVVPPLAVFQTPPV